MGDVVRVTLDQLIARKAQREKDRFKTKLIYVRSLDANMLFKKIPEDTVLDIMEGADSDSRRSIVSAYRRLIYLCCEDLQNPELHRRIEVSDPFDTVEQLFELSDVLTIGAELMELLELEGYSDKVKN